jgi:hypothetical protein
VDEREHPLRHLAPDPLLDEHAVVVHQPILASESLGAKG